MPTDVIKTISPSSSPTTPDYTSLQAWEDAAPADLVSADQRWIGECLDQGTLTQSGGTILTVGGSTVDSTRYKILRCASGASFKDKPAVRTTPLYYDNTKGVAIEDTGSIAYGPFISITEDGFQMEGLQIQTPQFEGIDASAHTTGGGAAPQGLISKCIVIAGGSNAAPLAVISNIRHADIVNCLIVATKSSSAQGLALREGPTHIEGNTIIALNDHSSSQALDYLYNGNVNAHDLSNNAFFGWAAIGNDNVSNTWRGDYDATDLPSFPSGWAGTHFQTNLTFSSQFQNTTNDFRPQSTGGLHAGVPDSTYLTTDITGTARDATTPWIGAWEFVASSGSVVLLPGINIFKSFIKGR